MSEMHQQHQRLWHFIQRQNKMLSNPEAALSPCFEMIAFVLMFALLKQIFYPQINVIIHLNFTH